MEKFKRIGKINLVLEKPEATKMLPSKRAFERGLMAEQNGWIKRAIKLHKQAIKLDPNNTEALEQLSNIFLDEERLEEAEECCRKAVAINPLCPRLHRNLAFILHAQGCCSEAEQWYKKTLGLSPDYCEARCNLAFMYEELNQEAKALAEWETIVNCLDGPIFLRATAEFERKKILEKRKLAIVSRHVTPLRLKKRTNIGKKKLFLVS